MAQTPSPEPSPSPAPAPKSSVGVNQTFIGQGLGRLGLDADALLEADVAAMARANPGRFWLLLAIVAGLVLMGLSAWRQGWFTPIEHVYVELPGASGVQIGTPVRLKGFKIGEVDKIELEPNLDVKARLKLVKERMDLLGEDASARFGRDGPIGGKYIDVLPGSRQGKRLVAQATLPMDVGNELEDVMGTVKVAVEKLAVAIGKMEPILDDTKKLTGEAAEMRKDVRSSVEVMLQNMESMSAQLKKMGDTASNVTVRIDKDSQQMLADVRKILSQSEQAASSARSALQALDKEMPGALKSAQEALANAQVATDKLKSASGDVQQIISESKSDIPSTVRAARTAVQDVAEITDGAKKTWPISTFVSNSTAAKTTATGSSLGLDGGEGTAPPPAPVTVPGASKP
jgi:phospholipid/cholesterol/gamma-HCH transport system substrate-binding protein